MKRQFLGSSIGMDDIFMNKFMGSIISYYRLPLILYAYFQLDSETDNFILPMGVDVPQSGIGGQRYKIFNDSNHTLIISDLQKEVNRKFSTLYIGFLPFQG